MKKRESNSSGRAGAFERLRYLIDLFMMRWRGRGRFDNKRNRDRVREYHQIAGCHGIDLKAAQVLEIGVGQRPYLGITLLGMGYRYRGIDLDLPIYPPTFAKIRHLYRANGALRMAKTLSRYFLFDRPEYQSLFNDLGLSPRQVQKSELFVQGNAALVDLRVICPAAESCPQMPLVVISESVFEHIPSRDLSLILENLRTYAARSNRPLLILSRPTIFTGICGSHLTEWYHHNVYSKKAKRSEPWEHLRKRRYVADTYLNQLTRADYRHLFEACGYVIYSETVENPGLGAEYLHEPALREELAAWSEDELLSNEVMFELIPTTGADPL